MKKGKSRGHKNNNPFNLIDSNIKWQGETGLNKDLKFEEFKTLVSGIRAGYKNLMNGYKGKGFDTPLTLVAKYAPAHENNVIAYADFLANSLQIHPNDMIQDWPLLAFSIMRFENGYNIMTYREFEKTLKQLNLI